MQTRRSTGDVTVTRLIQKTLENISKTGYEIRHFSGLRWVGHHRFTQRYRQWVLMVPHTVLYSLDVSDVLMYLRWSEMLSSLWQRVGAGSAVSCQLQKHLSRAADKQVRWWQVMIGYESLIRSEMERGSALCQTHGCIRDVTAKAQEHSVKPLWVNTGPPARPPVLFMSHTRCSFVFKQTYFTVYHINQRQNQVKAVFVCSPESVRARCPPFISLGQLWKAPLACGAAAKIECQRLVYFSPLFIADSLDLVPNGGPLLHHSPASFA